MTPPQRDAPSFADLGVPDDLIDALDGQGIERPFAIQAETIPHALAGRDVSGRAPTGSGKTLAFGVPLVANVQRARPKRPRALVLVPTRELAAQVSRDLARIGSSRDVRVHAFYGGTKFEPQIKALRRGVDIAVACPGRLADLVNQGIVRLDGVDLVVIDEADRMADMGFLPEVRRLVDQTDAERQVLLFSATLDGDIDALVRRYQHDPVTVDVTPDVPVGRLAHHFWSVPHARKIEVTAAVIQRVGPSVVFTRTRYGADRVARQLERAGVEAVPIHGNRTQNQRERALRAFRDGRARALVATDVAARGIHVDDVACVVHFDLPTDPKDFVHRSGRTGRAGATGIVIALAMPDRRKDNDKLFRSLDVDVTVTDPDVEGLPVGPAPALEKPQRADRASGDRRYANAPADRRTKHKPSGNRRKPRAETPADTRPGKKKGAPTRSRHDSDARAASWGARPGQKRRPRQGGPRSDGPWRDDPWRNGERSRSGGPRDRSGETRPGGSRPRRTPGGDGDFADVDGSGPDTRKAKRGKPSGPKPTGNKSKGPKAKRPKPGGPGSKKSKAKRALAPAPKRKPKNRARNQTGAKGPSQANRSAGRGRPGAAP